MQGGRGWPALPPVAEPSLRGAALGRVLSRLKAWPPKPVGPTLYRVVLYGEHRARAGNTADLA